MNTTPATAGPGFLAALIPLTRYDNSFEVTISADHFSLTVEVSACGHAPLKATGTPMALERALPAAITKYAQWVEAKETTGDAAGVKIDFPSAMAKPKPAPRVRKAVARKKPARRKPVSRARPAAARPRRAIVARKPTAPAQAGLAGKDACIADYKALKATHGAKITRRLFVDNAKTGRRYEKLWGNSWPTFVREAEGAKSAPATTAKPDAAAATSTPKKEAKKAAPKTTKPAKADKGPWALKVKGKQIGATIFDKKPGDTITLSQGSFTVQSVDAEKREIQVEPVSAKPAAPAAAPKSETSPASAAAAPKQVPYAIKTPEGTTLAATVKELAIGAIWGPFDRWEVAAVDHDKREYTVKDRTKSTTHATDAAAAAPSATPTEQPA